MVFSGSVITHNNDSVIETSAPSAAADLLPRMESSSLPFNYPGSIVLKNLEEKRPK